GEQRKQNHCGNEDQLVFDNPFKQHEHHRPGHGHRHGQSHRHENDCGTADQTKQPPATIEPPPTDSTPVTNPGDVTPPTDSTTPPTDSTSPPPPVIDNTSIAQLTQLSEQLLPVHQNGTYATSDWETLHATQAQKATTAAQNGSNLEFFGDSITEAMGYNPAAMEPFKQAFGDAKPTSLAIGGDGTAQLLYRLNHGEMQGQPKVAVLMIGTNDIGSLSPEQIADNTGKSIQSIQLRSPNTKVLVMGVLPRPEAGDPGNTQVDATNAALARLATTNGAVQFANLRDSFLDGNGKERPELYQADKLHLTPAGYQAWADGTRATIDQMLNSAAVPANSGSDTPISTADGPLTLDTAAIRGVNLSGAEWGKNNSADSQFWPTPEELDYYKSKGMNTFRLMLSWEQLQPTLNGPLDPSEMNRLTNFLHAADERGLKVLLTGGSFNRYTLNHGPNGQGADGETNGTLVGQPGVPVSAMQDFWTKMVKQIDGDPSASRAVGGWDLTNEPHDTNGAWAATATAVDQAIRATGDNHTIVVEGDQWARDFNGLEGLARADKNIAFEAHSYWDDGSGGYSNPNPPADANVGVNHIRPFVDWLKQNNARGFVGEWGVPTNSTAWAPEVKNFIQYLNQNDIGNMVWAGGPGWQPGYTLSVEPINGQDRAIMATIMEANQIAY
ncbi:MAG: cellulase family glycosylhydrolase, partial [Cyanobacteria bacterium SZAS LIN-3]|nr:cellulase family glycosylhydrolase [Cyanobacteria bacterium SZAS LIN-3]